MLFTTGLIGSFSLCVFTHMYALSLGAFGFMFIMCVYVCIYQHVTFLDCLLGLILVKICGIFIQVRYVVFLYEGINFSVLVCFC